MKSINPQRNIAIILLISLFLQSCGLSQPIELDSSQATGAQLRAVVSQSGAEKVLEAQTRDIQSALRAHYQHVDFRAMPSFLDEAPMSVEDWVETPIAVEDLFKPRSIYPSAKTVDDEMVESSYLSVKSTEPVKEITKVLLTGEAGTGKTSLTKKLAYSWSVGKWGQEFTSVYVLPVRALRSDKYNGSSPFRQESLTTAVVNECLLGARSKSRQVYDQWLSQVSYQLQQSSTLLILDGLDAQYGVSQAILKEAKSGNHKLLITSRPYGVETERSLVDIEIKHVGFDIIQRDWFVHRVLAGANQNTPDKLLSFIKDHHLEEMSQVPVNLRILSALWKTRGDEITQYNPGLPGLYRELVNHVWEQFATRGASRREHTRSEKESLFEDLEKVALESLQRGEIIRRSTCEEVLGNTPSPLLQDSGFLLFQKIDHQYQFLHLTFQEYFAGRSLARKLLLGQQDEVAAFLREHMYVPRHKRTLSFMAGEMSKGMPQELRLASPKERIAPMRDLLRLLSSVPRDILGVRHLLLELRLLDEWLLVSSPSWVSESLANLEGEFGLGQRLITWFNKALRQYRQYDKSTQILYTTLMTLLSEANGVTKHYGTELRKHILNALQDGDSDVRNAALAALQTLLEKGVEVQEMVSPMLNALQDRDRCLREFAIEVLGTLLEHGAEVQEMLPPILNALQDSHADVREAALKALRALLEKGVEVQGVVPPMLNALQDRDFPVREAALKALRTLLLEKGAEVQGMITPILNVLQDRHAGVRWAALAALGTLLEQGAEVQEMAPLILNALQHDNSDVRRAALKALETLLEQGAAVQEMITPMLNALQDKHADVRIAALAALRTLLEQGVEVQEMITPMLNLLQDRHADVRKAVLEALGTLLEQGAEVQGMLPPILNALQDRHADVRESALVALRTLLEKGAGVQEMLPPILNALQDRYADVRKAALAALQTLLEQGTGVQGMIPPVLNALQDRYSDVRESALATLRTLLERGAAVQEILPPTLNALQHGNADVRRVALAALRTLLEHGAEVQGMLPSILNALQDSHADVCIAALEALPPLLGHGAAVQEILPPILNALQHDYAAVRQSALEALLALLEKGVEVQGILSLILNALQDRYSDVRRTALEVLGTLSEQDAEAQAIVPPVLNALQDRYSDVRIAAIEVLGTLLKQGAEAQGMLPPILNVLQDRCPDVLRATLHALLVLLEKGAEVQEMIPPILNVLQHSDWCARRHAIQALRTLLEHGAEVQGMLSPMLNVLQDSDWCVREFALEVLRTLLEQGAEARGMLPSILNALQDKNFPVRKAALEAFGQISTESLIDFYWETKDEFVIPFLVPRLYEVALTVEDMESSGQQKLVLRSVQGDVVRVWEKMQEEVEGFKRLVQGSGTCFGG